MNRPNANKRRAFTLIELLLVLVILAVLAAVVIPKLTGRVEDARIKGTIAELSNLKTAMETYEADNGKYPSALEDLVICPAGLENTWHGKYIDSVPEDKWGHTYQYMGPETMGGQQFNIISAGPDGNFNTGDDLFAIAPDQ
jgi:general secretion pathway protein G